MNKKIFILLAVLAALALVFVACENEPVTEDTTVSTEAPTDAATDAPTEEATTPAETPSEETTTPAETPTTEEVTTEEVTTEEVTTEEPTTEGPRYDNYDVPMDSWGVSGHAPGLTEAAPAPAIGGAVQAAGLEKGAMLHKGAVSIGEIDLSKYEKVVVYYGIDNSDVTFGLYNENANNRVILSKVDTNNSLSPAEEDIIASATYTPQGWSLVAVEIDLTEVDYNGPVYVTYDTLGGTFMLIGKIEFIGAVIPEGAEIPEQGGNETPEQGGNETPDAPETYEVDLATVGVTGNWPIVDNPVPGSVFGKDHCIALHYGSIALGEMDLSKYSKVTVTYATPDDATVAGASDQYNKTAKRVMLLNTPSAAEGAFECLPEESAIVAYNQYERSPASLTLTTVEIDLTEVTYNGELYLTFDFRGAGNAQAAEGYLIWLTGISFS